MAKDVDPAIAEYSRLYELNQRMKLMCDIYIIHDNYVYMHSLIDFVEKYVKMKAPFTVFNNVAILPNQLFQFTKSIKKSKLFVRETDDEIIMGDTEDDNLVIHIKRFLPSTVINQPNGNSVVEDYLKKNAITKFYKMPDDLFDSNESYTALKPDIVDDLLYPYVVTLHIGAHSFVITRNIIPSLKKDDNLYVKKVREENSDNLNKSYLIFREENKFFDVFTLGAFIQFV